MNPNSQNANVPELLSQVEDQALSPGRAAIFNTKVNLQAATATSRVFTELGLKYRGILTPVNSPSEIRRSFGMMSQSASAAARGAAAFSKVAMGGGFAV
jgi:hypothetical protein